MVFDGLVRRPGASVRLGTTNWQRLRKSGFPPSFSSAHSSSKPTSSTSDRHQRAWPSTSDLLGDLNPSPSPPLPKAKSKRALLGVLTPRLRKIECSGNCTVKFQATVWGQRIAAGFPDAIVVPGALVTQLWNQAVAEFGGGDSLDIDEAAEVVVPYIKFPFFFLTMWNDLYCLALYSAAFFFGICWPLLFFLLPFLCR